MPASASVTLRGPEPLVRRHGRPRARLLLAAAALIFSIACKGAPEVKLPGPESTTPPLSKVDFNARANEICRATTKAIADRTEDVGDDHQKLRDQVKPIVALTMTRLRNLTPPPEDAALVKRGFDAMQAAVDALATDPQAPLDPVGLNRPEQFAYGLTGCFAQY